MGLAALRALSDFPSLEVAVDMGDGPKRLKTPVLAVSKRNIGRLMPTISRNVLGQPQRTTP